MALIIFLSASLLSLSQAGWPHVYSGEHFNKLMTMPIDSIAARSAVLVLYTPECEKELDLKSLDIDNHLMYFTHDYVKGPQHVWFKYRAQDDLHQKYAQDDLTCLSAYYFHRGRSLDSPTDAWTGRGSMTDWVWSLLKRNVIVTNNSSKKVTVLNIPTSEFGPETEGKSFVLPGQMHEVDTYLSYMVKVMD